MRLCHCASLLILALAGAASAADFIPVYHPELTVRRTPQAIVVDGELDDAGWQYAGRADNFAEHSPGDQTQPPVATEAWLTYDDDHLYVAFRCADDPALLRASFTERDRIWNDDYVMLLLDTYGEQTWAYEIAANPYGIQGDLLWSTNGDEDMTYDLVYATAARITAQGWQVEMAIPWSSLRFPRRDLQEWRVDFWRNRPREAREQSSWAAYDRDDPCWPCRWGTVLGVAGVVPGKGLALLPAYVASQAGRRGEDGGFVNGDIVGEPSGSVRYDFSSSLSAEATANPDFSQVESDAAQIDVNTTFALSYPEKRPFFQEGSDLFATWFNAVYTRTINDPTFAAKLVGRPGADNLALLVARDENSPFILPFEERSAFVAAGRSVSTLARIQHSLGDGSHVGLIATDRRHDGGGAGSLAGVDWRQRLDRNWQIETQVLATHTTEPNDTSLTTGINDLLFDRGAHTAAFDGESFSGHAVYASLERSARHWSCDVDYYGRSATFRAENGFEPQNDRHAVTGWTAYTIYGDGLFERWQPQAFAGRVWNFAGTKKDEWLGATLYTRLGVAQTELSAEVLVSNELFQGIQFDGIRALSLEVESKPSAMIAAGAEGAVGDRIARGFLVMGRQTNLDIWLDLKPFDRLILESRYDYARSEDRDTGEELFAGWVARTRVGFQMTRELSLRLVLQYDDFDRLWEADPLLTYRLNPFSIFYVGSTRDYLDYDDTRPIAGWRLADRSYFLKLQYLFQV
jgi:hypothetical protein